MSRLSVLALALSACDGSATDCPDDLPESCPDPAPTWSGDVAPIVSRTCANCHDGAVQTPVLDDLASVQANRGEVLSQIYGCVMPPVGSAYSLTDDERAALLGWLVCGAPSD